jgi:hypothetical protein
LNGFARKGERLTVDLVSAFALAPFFAALVFARRE